MGCWCVGEFREPPVLHTWMQQAAAPPLCGYLWDESIKSVAAGGTSSRVRILDMRKCNSLNYFGYHWLSSGSGKGIWLFSLPLSFFFLMTTSLCTPFCLNTNEMLRIKSKFKNCWIIQWAPNLPALFQFPPVLTALRSVFWYLN